MKVIKVCGMREPGNIQALVEEVSPDLMGLIFYEKSPRYVDHTLSTVIREVPIPKVGVFVNAAPHTILERVEQYGLQYVQLHGDEGLDVVGFLRENSPVKIIKVYRVSEDVAWDELAPYEGLVDYFLFDTQTKAYGGSGHQFEWQVLETYPFRTPFLLSGGISEQHEEEINALGKKLPKMAGIDINSRFEISPGLKDIDRIRTFVSRLRDK